MLGPGERPADRNRECTRTAAKPRAGLSVTGSGIRTACCYARPDCPGLPVARLLHANTAFEDEALYLWAGHLEWAHWLHGARIPVFPTYFSGAPVIYPPLGALADSIGGLAGARILSLVFMLGATVLLWATTTRLYGQRAAFFAAGLWAVIGPTQRLGAFATFDAMALFLVAFAAWCVTGGRRRREVTRWMLAGACAMVFANATKYASALFDPIGRQRLAFLSGYPAGRKDAQRRVAYLLAVMVTLIIISVSRSGSAGTSGDRADDAGPA